MILPLTLLMFAMSTPPAPGARPTAASKEQSKAALIAAGVVTSLGLLLKGFGTLEWDRAIDEDDAAKRSRSTKNARVLSGVGIGVALLGGMYWLMGTHLRAELDADEELRRTGHTGHHGRVLAAVGFTFVGLGTVALVTTQVLYGKHRSRDAMVWRELGNYGGTLACVGGLAMAGYGLGTLRTESRARLSFAVGRGHVGFAVTGRF